MIERLIVIAPPFDHEFYDYLKRKFASDPNVVVIAERRAWQRRKQPSLRVPDPRHADRRRRNSTGLVVTTRSAAVTAREASRAEGSA